MGDNIADHNYRYSERKRETNTIQRRMSTYNRTPRQTERKRETYPDTRADIQSQRERQKYESRDVRIHAVLIIIVIHTHIFESVLTH